MRELLDHPVVEELKKELHFESFDDIYEDNATFEEVYETIVNELIQRANSKILFMQFRVILAWPRRRRQS